MSSIGFAAACAMVRTMLAAPLLIAASGPPFILISAFARLLFLSRYGQLSNYQLHRAAQALINGRHVAFASSVLWVWRRGHDR
jgi:hypothetical protein